MKINVFRNKITFHPHLRLINWLLIRNIASQWTCPLDSDQHYKTEKKELSCVDGSALKRKYFETKTSYMLTDQLSVYAMFSKIMKAEG